MRLPYLWRRRRATTVCAARARRAVPLVRLGLLTRKRTESVHTCTMQPYISHRALSTMHTREQVWGALRSLRETRAIKEKKKTKRMSLSSQVKTG